MWGYIAFDSEKNGSGVVPSLYVRVYRHPERVRDMDACSLIICEGISMITCSRSCCLAFPHYMWGYIAGREVVGQNKAVPSLYVRVYRRVFSFVKWCGGFLIICEGISPFRAYYFCSRPFPHYMWGYIVLRTQNAPFMKVPSLYVRVYHQHGKLLKSLKCSLIICEGISGTLIFGGWWILFPHYMWGYITSGQV